MTDVNSPSPHDPRLTEDEESQLREVRMPFATFRSVFALMLREMSTSYGRSPGGYIWAVIEPAAGIGLMTFIFSAGFRHPPLGTSFPLFYACAMLPFLMYGDIAMKLAQVLNFSRALLEYPRVTFVDALIARFILNVMTQFMVHIAVMAVILTFFADDVSIDVGKVATAYVMLIIFSVGVGTLNSFLFVSFPVWQTSWAVLNRPIFLVSCIFFLFETVPEPYRSVLWYNPLVHPIGMMRDAFYPYYSPTYVSATYPVMLGLIGLLVGLFLLNRYHRDILDK
ncbi:ABC transporter permease [Roseovarius sp. THAF9]|uniref:ABC transporter permease n=1 Tax=Roseovarius sp. THAF9 TaxID=2587847 RepID=UPI0020C76253|nr:ABC transporter permease [Roseovarius sp. THAF9]